MIRFKGENAAIVTTDVPLLGEQQTKVGLTLGVYAPQMVLIEDPLGDKVVFCPEEWQGIKTAIDELLSK